MRARRSVIRGFLVALALLLLVTPVGVDEDGVRRVASIDEALAELASGALGVGLLSAVVAGDDLATAAFLRLAILAGVGFVYFLSHAVNFERRAPVEPPPRRRCPACRGWVSTSMHTCPGCGRVLYVD